MNKEFWEKQHASNIKYWLTGTKLTSIQTYHRISFKEYKDRKILEIGVGLGDTLHSLREYTKNLYAADISDKALNKVSSFSSVYSTKDLVKIPPVDLAICHLVFQHCDDQEVERIINDVQLLDTGIFSFQYAYFREANPIKFSDEFVDINETHFFRSQEKMRAIITRSNKKIIGTPEIRVHPDFNWEIIKVENK